MIQKEKKKTHQDQLRMTSTELFAELLAVAQHAVRGVSYRLGS